MRKVVVLGSISSYAVKQFIRASSNLGVSSLFIFYKGHVPCIDELNSGNTMTVSTLGIEGRDEIIKRLEAIEDEIESIVPGGELAVPIAEALCSYFSLPYNRGNPERFRNKELMRKELGKAGISQPKIFAKIESENDLVMVRNNLEYPLIIKPVDGAASFFVKKIHKESELASLVNQISEHVDSKATGVKFIRHSLLEEFINGDEYSAEVLVSDNRCIRYFVTRKVLSEEPYFDEIGHISLLRDDEPAGADDLVKAVIDSMQVENGVLHVEFRQDRKGELFVIEVAARIAGDLISNIVQYTHIHSLEEFLIQARSKRGLASESEMHSPSNSTHTGVRFIFDDSQHDLGGINIIERGITQQYNDVENVSPCNVLKRRGYEIFQSNSLIKSLKYIG